MFVDVTALPQRLLSLCVAATSAVALALLVIAGADFTWTRIHWRRDLRMSRQELKEEIKQAEGDRMLKARLRSLRMDRARRNMMKNVPQATMVIVNPDPLRGRDALCALRRRRADGARQGRRPDRPEDPRDRVRERHSRDRGQAAGALALRAVARSTRSIPPEFYRAVAEIVHLIQTKRAAWPLSRRRLN